MSACEASAVEGGNGSAAGETPGNEAPTPASAEALRKLRRDKLALGMRTPGLTIYFDSKTSTSKG
jgi:hypothetical protein